ncbi:hypothetical protein IG3_04775 [Bacillus cereus HuA2-1]|uniref:Uncharacterized protein n=1 Tax=Bacillus cereus HuA2-1 TaxID=1053201 RepID=J9BVB2_BACCE|nr:hypothetical protein IG3_04775 [Bacillus cereus HuA2-1]
MRMIFKLSEIHENYLVFYLCESFGLYYLKFQTLNMKS